MRFLIPPHFGMNARLADQRDEVGDVVEVETTSIDSLTRGWPRVDLIKIDVEGAEEAVWRGMQETLARNPDVVVILEVNTARYEDPRRFFAELERGGFPLRYIDHDGATPTISRRQLVHSTSGEDWVPLPSPLGRPTHLGRALVESEHA